MDLDFKTIQSLIDQMVKYLLNVRNHVSTGPCIKTAKYTIIVLLAACNNNS